jgi:hypothetical protein
MGQDSDSTSGHPYRPTPSAPNEARWRNWWGLVAMVVIGVAFLGLNLSSHSSLSCDRAAGSCQLLQQTVAGSSVRPLALAEITGAKLVIMNQRRHSTTFEVDLATRSEVIHLGSGKSESDMRSFVQAVNAFVRTPAQQKLDAAYGDVWATAKFWAWIFAAVFLVFSYATPAVRVSLDPGDPLLVFDIRPFGALLARRLTYPAASVLEARPYLSGIGLKGRSLSVRLYMVDGTSVGVAGSASSARRCRQIADMINGVLGRRGSSN